MTLDAAIRERAENWAKLDPNPVTSKYVQELLDQSSSQTDAAEKICNLFPDGRIGFGTAGLRSTMTPGPMGMNDLVVVQAAQGIAKYVLQQNQVKEGEKLGAVIGYDHREQNALELSSLSFALLTALVFEQAGLDTVLLDGFVATPLVPFTLSKRKAVVGIMITASHNPKNDAGYKVYWNNGCQIRAPVDKGIAEAILENLTPWVDYGALLKARKERHSEEPCLGLSSPDTTKEMISAYFETIKSCGLVTGQASLLSQFKDDAWKPPSIAYTAMHGVGLPFAVRSYETFGFPPFQAVPSQMNPDPSFPTVPFPNPEEKGALDISKAFAEEHGCDVIIGNDPDADRLAVAERDRKTGKWTVFTGDQIGSMLGCWLYEQVGKPSGKRVSMCASTVSSKMLAEIARVEGFYFEDTLTGFKWIGSRAEELNREGYFALFGYEEAIGFSCGNVVFDKDGISGLGVFTELTYNVYQKGMSLAQHMQSLYDKYGEFCSNNGPQCCAKDHGHYDLQWAIQLDTVGPYKVDSTRYLGEPAYDSTTDNKLPRLATSKSSPMITLRFTNGCVAQFRASGTEPKFKYYIEMKGQVGASRENVEAELMKFSETIIRELVKPEEHGLIVPSKG
ncbi:Glucose 1,6-bisphosphate synthase [Seminavis robusta]|uniref:Glucose 1,6-bisphosphate synthase n=1 Tax=Seminavis robusta TaxID=568900 RepID=A0A9N8HYL5_9STRA|nr:Glucose 1,6-bisphosphate synthase [Seminavis robusta]|eukprot:Sro2552_g331000.1 Glucose 1,6-bisphosphate synthase (619) ;mRNA; f:9531-11600